MNDSSPSPVAESAFKISENESPRPQEQVAAETAAKTNRLKQLLGTRPLLAALAIVLVLFGLGGLIVLLVPSVRESVRTTASHLLGQDQNLEQHNGDNLNGEEVKLALSITSPQNNITTQDAKVTVTGSTDPAATLTINDIKVETSEGKFSKEIELKEGINLILIKAKLGEKSSIRELKITRGDGIEPTASPTPKPTEKPKETGIKLTGGTADGGIKLNWSVSGLNTPDGFKIVRSTESSSPVYPGNDYTYVENGNLREYLLDLKDGKSYYIRVCQYIAEGSKCGVYSNTVHVTAPHVSEPTVTGISIEHTGTYVHWTATGTPTYGFWFLWSATDTTPSPGEDGVNKTSFGADGNNKTLEGDSGTTFHVRVCNKLSNSTCDKYSDVIEVAIP